MRSSYFLFFIFFLCFQCGCYFQPHYLLLGKDKWVTYKNNSINQNMINDFEIYEKYNFGEIVYDYFGYFTKNNRKVVDFSHVQRIDYLYGYIYVRRDVNTILWWQKVPLFHFTAFQSEGIIASNQEVWARPTLVNFVLSFVLNIGGFFSGGFVVPTRVWEEECFHATQEIFHPSASSFSEKLMYNISLRHKVPIVSPAISYVTYLLHPMEIDAKIKKWLFFGFVINLDCDNAWQRYCNFRVYVAMTKLWYKGIFISDRDQLMVKVYLYHSKNNNNFHVSYFSGNSLALLKEVENISGIVQRRSYETKLIYAPFVAGTMREDNELPWLTRTFLAPFLRIDGN